MSSEYIPPKDGPARYSISQTWPMALYQDGRASEAAREVMTDHAKADVARHYREITGDPEEKRMFYMIIENEDGELEQVICPPDEADCAVIYLSFETRPK